MIWYTNTLDFPQGQVLVEGSFKNSVLSISANGHELYQKIINTWRAEEVLEEDVLAKFQGMIKKCEAKVPLMIKTGKLIL